MKISDTLRILFLLTLPIFLLFCFIIWMVIEMGHHGKNYEYAALAAFLGVSLLEVFIFRRGILPRVSEADRIRRLLNDQDMIGKMLVRRDLELTQANEKLRQL